MLILLRCKGSEEEKEGEEGEEGKKKKELTL